MDFLKPDQHSIRNLHCVAGIASIIVGVYALLFSWETWRDEKSDQINEFVTIMELGSKAVNAYLTQLENALLALNKELTEPSDQIDLERAFILLKRFKEAHPDLVNITFISLDGQVLMTAKTPPGMGHPSLAQQPSFVRYRDELRQGQAVSLGRPLIGVVSKVLNIPFRHGIRDQQGNLRYIVSANISEELLQSFWKEAPVTKKAALGLIRDDGFLISRYPVPSQMPLDAIYGEQRTGALIRHLQKHNFPVSGYVEGPSSLDGTDFLTAFQRLPHFPVTLFVAMPQSEIRAAWWEKIRMVYLLMVFLSIGGGLTYRFAVHRQHTWDRERQSAGAVLQASEQRLQQVLEGSNDGFWDWDMATGAVFFSRRWAEMLGYDFAEIEPNLHAWEKLVHPDDLAQIWTTVNDHLTGETPRFHVEYRMRAKDGKWHWILSRAKVVARNAEGQPSRLTGTHTEITALKQMQEALREQAVHDPLTGLFNRRYLDETLLRELHRRQRSGEPLTVAMMDLDHFKHFNDAYGHEAGDLVLQAVGELLRCSLRAGDIACRYGGEELTVIMPGSALGAAHHRLDDVRQAIMHLCLRCRNEPLPAITVSIGAAEAADEETDPAALLSRADAALYQAKAQGRNRMVVTPNQGINV